MALHLGKLAYGTTYFTRKLEVFATVAPAVGRASKWSKPFKTKIDKSFTFDLDINKLSFNEGDFLKRQFFKKTNF